MRVFARVSCLAWCIGLLGFAASAAAAPDPAAQQLAKIAGILDYIGGDYRGAVGPDGAVLDQGEYDEQLSLADDADAIAAQAGLPESDPLRHGLRNLKRALEERGNPEAIATQCRTLRAALGQHHGVQLGPSSIPSRADGARLYVQNGCGTCHGADGSANTDAARALDPRPANFLDPERVLTVSPHRAFFAITSGVAGTGMAGYPQLSEADRWSLAFYVLSMRHLQADLAKGRTAFERASAPLPATAGHLAILTEEEIANTLAASKLDPQQRALALAYLRADAPFANPAASPSGKLGYARTALQAGVRAYEEGKPEVARERFLSAYLDGFEPYEAGLSAREPELVRKIEQGMLGLRQAATRGAPAADVQRKVEAVDQLLAQAESGRGDGNTAFVGALTIALREGVEIALLLGALLGLVRKRQRPELVKYVHAGWMLAVVAGLITWWGAGELVSGLGRELAEGIAALLAAVVLLGVTHWLLGQLSAKRFMGFLADRLSRASAGSGRAAAASILGLSFVAVYREAFELVLFYKALLLDAGAERSRVWLGVVIGLAVLIIVVLILKRVGQRLSPRPFMQLSSVLLSLLAVTLTGKGIRALQEAGVIEPTLVAFPELSWFGVYPTVEGLAAQGLMLLLLLASALWPFISARLGKDQPQPAQ